MNYDINNLCEKFSQDMFSLKGKVAAVTGGNKGLGLCVCNCTS